MFASVVGRRLNKVNHYGFSLIPVIQLKDFYKAAAAVRFTETNKRNCNKNKKIKWKGSRKKNTFTSETTQNHQDRKDALKKENTHQYLSNCLKIVIQAKDGRVTKS